MGESQKEESHGEDAPPPSGMEINLGDFTRTVGLLKSLRLMLNNQMVVNVEDLASSVNDAGRKFKLGEIEQANIEVARSYSAFSQRTNQWENQARNLEQQMKMQAAKNPKSISIDAMNRMKSEQVAVRTRIRTAEVHFRRLQQALDQAYTNLQQQPKPATSKTPTGLPADFLASFQAAAATERANIIKQHFEIEVILKADVSRSVKGGYDIRFEPLPPVDRLYFLTKPTQIVRLLQLGTTVTIQDLETEQENEIKLVEFVKHVQSGVWLLKPRP
jgi:hypothetical protein